jgi:hypothetical protein
LRRCAGWLAQASLAFMRGCARSRPDRTALRRTPRCAGTSAASLSPSGGSMVHPASTRNCAGKGTGMRDAGSNGSCATWVCKPAVASGVSPKPRPAATTSRHDQPPRPAATTSRHDQPIAPNRLGRSFVAERPDAVWLADISYIPTDEGFLSLAAKGSGDASDCRLVDGRASQGRALHRRSGHGPPALPTPTGAHSP